MRKDALSMSKDKWLLRKDATAISKDKAPVLKDALAMSKDVMPMFKDELLIKFIVLQLPICPQGSEPLGDEPLHL